MSSVLCVILNWRTAEMSLKAAEAAMVAMGKDRLSGSGEAAQAASAAGARRARQNRFTEPKCVSPLLAPVGIRQAPDRTFIRRPHQDCKSGRTCRSTASRRRVGLPVFVRCGKVFSGKGTNR